MSNHRIVSSKEYSCVFCRFFISYQEEYDDVDEPDDIGTCGKLENIKENGDKLQAGICYTCDLICVLDGFKD